MKCSLAGIKRQARDLFSTGYLIFLKCNTCRYSDFDKNAILHVSNNSTINDILFLHLVCRLICFCPFIFLHLSHF